MNKIYFEVLTIVVFICNFLYCFFIHSFIELLISFSLISLLYALRSVHSRSFMDEAVNVVASIEAKIIIVHFYFKKTKNIHDF